MSQLLNEKMSVDPNSLTGIKVNTYGGPNVTMKPRKVVRRVDNIGEEGSTTSVDKIKEVVKKLKRLTKKSAARDYRISELNDLMENSLTVAFSQGNRKIDNNEIKVLKYLVQVGQFLEKNSNLIKYNKDLQQAVKALAASLQGKS